VYGDTLGPTRVRVPRKILFLQEFPTLTMNRPRTDETGYYSGPESRSEHYNMDVESVLTELLTLKNHQWLGVRMNLGRTIRPEYVVTFLAKIHFCYSEQLYGVGQRISLSALKAPPNIGLQKYLKLLDELQIRVNSTSSTVRKLRSRRL